ncbi:hypothetical protein OZ410_04605 [Robiginitalea sp. M366]|uniref:hypothetical protein n=1 Tax=Robiginitalea aestuariiviva TaxID=3036903 RepID=UPI00240DF1C5|nr:hypothetical protein [Robiginitalea aestuariiviva]MDG1571584.1 hypothetical protein [Robiginitalea aestuariiviva]
MKRKLKEELLRLCTDTLTNPDLTDLSQLHQRAQALYEKLAVLRFVEEKLQDVEVDVSKSEVASKFERIATAVLRENKQVPETNPHHEDIIVPGIDTIKHMVSEMPGGEELEEVLSKLIGNSEFVKNEPEILTPEVPEPPKAAVSKSLNDTLTAREISVGLNDRLAFVKHLFNDQPEAFRQVVERLNAMESQEKSLEYIRREVRSQYNWDGKEAYEQRFMELIERRFA